MSNGRVMMRSIAIRRIFAEAFKFRVRGSTQASAEHCSSARKTIERDDFPCELPGSSASNRRDERAQSQALGFDGNRGECKPSICDWNVGIPIKLEMVPEKKAIPSGVFGLKCQCDQVVGIAVFAEILHVNSGNWVSVDSQAVIR